MLIALTSMDLTDIPIRVGEIDSVMRLDKRPVKSRVTLHSGRSINVRETLEEIAAKVAKSLKER